MDDTKLNILDYKFVGEATVPEMQCVSMRQHLPWSFDLDTFGICCSAHVLLFGSHLEISQSRNKRWMPKERFLGHHSSELWTEVFDTLLNLENGNAIGSRPRSLRQLRNRIESHLQEGHKIEVLRKALTRLSCSLPTSRIQ